MNAKAIVGFTALATLFLAESAFADTVTAAKAAPFTPSGFTPAAFQIASAPGVWLATDYNALASAALMQAAGTNTYVEVSHQYDSGLALEEVTQIYMSDSSAQGIANRVWNFFLWANWPTGYGSPSDTAIIQMGTNNVSCVLSTPDQMAIATKALVNHKPVTFKATKTWFWDASQNKLVQLGACILTLN